MSLLYRLITLSVFCSLTVFTVANTAAAQIFEGEEDHREELRGVWITNVDSDIMFNRERLAKSMDYLAENGFNVIFPVVWNSQNTFFPSEVMNDYFGTNGLPIIYQASDRDPLQEIISEAHRVGIEVIPWFEYGFAAYHASRADQDMILENYPDWVARDRDGNIAERNNFYWMNGFKPEVQNFILELIEEVIENYDVDGIQGDDRLPAMPVDAGYSDYTVERYKDENDGNEPPNNPNNTDFKQWRADILSDFGGDLYDMVKEHDEHLIVSLSPGVFSWSRDNYLQDWPEWVERGQVDILHPQVYRRDLDNYISTLENQINHLGEENLEMLSPGILSGLRNDVVAPGTLVNKVKANREHNVNGEVYFFFETLEEANDYAADTLGREVYHEKTRLPHRNGELRREEAEISLHTDENNQKTGEWNSSDKKTGFRGSPVWAEGGSEATISWELEIPYDAWYHIYTHIPYLSRSDEATNSAVFEVTDSDGNITQREIDQTTRASRSWIKLDNVYLEAGAQPVVTLDASQAEDEEPIYGDATMITIDRSKSSGVGDVTSSPFEGITRELPDEITLAQNYPNPFNPETNISFTLPETRSVTLTVYDMMGRKIITLIQNRTLQSGRHSVSFDGSEISSGSYLYRLETETEITSQIMTLIK